MLGVAIELDWTAAAILTGAIGSIVTFFVLFDRVRRDQKWIKLELKKEKKARRAMLKVLGLIRHDQVKIMANIEHPIQPSKLGDTGVYDAIAADISVDELLLDDDDEDD
jgi:hypothetical protein